MIVDLYLLISAVCSAYLSYAVAGEFGITALLIFLGMTVGIFAGLILLHFIVFFIAGLFSDMSEPCMKHRPFYRKVAAVTASGLMRVMGARVHISGDTLPDGRFLLISNHLSCFDPIICIDKFRAYEIAFISKPENFKIPLVGRFIQSCNFLPIDRDNARNAMRTINTAVDLIKNDVCSIGIYPEGTRSKDGSLGEFHDGVLRIATKAKVPIAVITVRGTEKIAHNFPLRATDVSMKIERIITPEEYESMDYHEIADMARGIMLDSLSHE